jgi:hypothetical protein
VAREPEQLRLPFDDDDGTVAPPSRRVQLARWAEDHDVEIVFFDPPEEFDDAILGVIHGFGQEFAVVYDEAVVLAAMRRDMADDAEEWFWHNTAGAFVGEATPRFLIRPWDWDYDASPTDPADRLTPEEEPDVEET